MAGKTAARHDHVDVGMVGHGRAPAVEHRGEADPGTQVFGVGSDGEHGLGAGLEQDGVDHALVLVGDVGDLAGECKDEVEIADGQELGLALGQPGPGRGALALGAMAVAARIIGDVLVGAVLTARDMAAQRRRAAALDG